MTTTDWMDISVPIHTGMVHWPDNPPVRVEYMLHIERGDICTVSTLSMGSHTGTHMDCLPLKITGSDGSPARAILRRVGGA